MYQNETTLKHDGSKVTFGLNYTINSKLIYE